MLGVFAFGSSGFTASEFQQSNQEVDCNEYAAQGWQDAVDVGLRGDILNTIFEVQYFYCENFVNPL